MLPNNKQDPFDFEEGLRMFDELEGDDWIENFLDEESDDLTEAEIDDLEKRVQNEQV